MKTLDHSNAQAYFDPETGIAHITYFGLLTAEASTAVYDWLADIAQKVGIEKIYGEIFDFREVTEFLPDNLLEARRKSKRYNLSNDIRQLPVAMIVKDFYQEEILRGPMQNVEENQRKTIVQNMDDAVQFLHQWHHENNNGN
jgi:hypothetical protein